MKGRKRIYDPYLREALLGASDTGMLTPDILAAMTARIGVAKRIGVQYALKQLLEEGIVARVFEWRRDERGRPTQRVYRYFLANLAPNDLPYLEVKQAPLFQQTPESTPISGWNWGR